MKSTAFRLRAVTNIRVDSAHKKCCLSLAQIKENMLANVCALRILLIAQQIILRTLKRFSDKIAYSVGFAKQSDKPNQVDSQAPAQNKEADVASLHLGGLQLSARLKISFGADPGLARPVLPANPSRYTVCHALLHLPYKYTVIHPQS